MTEKFKPMLCSYRMTDDIGFAPNPHHGVLTLATCKPVIRRSQNVQPGMWIAGWAGSALGVKGKPSLVYLALISEKISMAEYWEKYPKKRPVAGKKGFKYTDGNAPSCKGCGFKDVEDNDPRLMGDNIYKPDDNGVLQWQPNNDHGKDQYDRDASGKNVLICHEFYYFGGEDKNYLAVDENIRVEIPVSRGHKFTSDVNNHVSNLIDYVKKHIKEAKIVGV